MDDSNRNGTGVRLSMFQQVMITVFAAGMISVVGMSVNTTISNAELAAEVKYLREDVATLKRKVDQNILPLADARLTRLETELKDISKTIHNLEQIINRLDEHNHPRHNP